MPKERKKKRKKKKKENWAGKQKQLLLFAWHFMCGI